MKLLHITDPHLVAPGEMLHGLNPDERLRACIDDILKHHADAQACVITGDLTHRGELAGYQTLSAQLRRLPMPVFPLVGNHDRRSVLRRALADVLDDGNGYVQGVQRLGTHSLVMLDTLSEGENGGRYDGTRPDWLRQVLDRECAQGQQVLLYLHHPPFPIGIPCLDRISLAHPQELAELLGNYPNIRHMFFGHVHRPVCGTWRGISFSTMRGLNHQVPFDLQTLSPVPKSHEPPAYAVSLVSPESVVTHFHDFLDRSLYVAPARGL